MIHTCIRIAGEVAGPFDEGASLELSRSDCIAANGGENGRIAELRLGSDDAVRDVVIDGLQLSLVSRPSRAIRGNEVDIRCAPPA